MEEGKFGQILGGIEAQIEAKQKELNDIKEKLNSMEQSRAQTLQMFTMPQIFLHDVSVLIGNNRQCKKFSPDSEFSSLSAFAKTILPHSTTEICMPSACGKTWLRNNRDIAMLFRSTSAAGKKTITLSPLSITDAASFASIDFTLDTQKIDSSITFRVSPSKDSKYSAFFSLPAGTQFSAAEETLKKAFGFQKRLIFKDEDGDFVEISSQDSWQYFNSFNYTENLKGWSACIFSESM